MTLQQFERAVGAYLDRLLAEDEEQGIDIEVLCSDESAGCDTTLVYATPL